VPVLRDAEEKGLLEIASRARELARKAREGTLTVDEVTRGNVYHFKCGHVSGGRGPGQRVSANRGPLSGRSLFNHDVIYRTHVVYRNQGNGKLKGMCISFFAMP